MTYSDSDSRATNPTVAVRDAIGNWFSRNFIWQIPVYQRHYAWDAADPAGPIHLFWETLKEQTEKRLNGETPNQHYLGTVLVDEKRPIDATLSDVKYYDVVDGQQRLTTIQIAMMALIKVAGDFDCKEIRNDLKDYIYLSGNSNQMENKLNPTNFDEGQFNDVLFNTLRQAPEDDQNIFVENYKKSKVWRTFLFLQEKFKGVIENTAPKKAIYAIKESITNGFDIVVIHLAPSDDAQQIFESLNSHARPLTTFDLIRNNVFYRAGNDAEKLFKNALWSEFEKPYWEKVATAQKQDPPTHIETYVARVLVAKQRENFRFTRSEIFHAYKKFSKAFSSVEAEVEELARYRDVYQYLNDVKGQESPLSGCDFGVFRYNVWNNRDFYPVIFSIVSGDASDDEKKKMIHLLESYVIRRRVCGLSTGNYNRQAVTICDKLKDEPSYQKLSGVLKLSKKSTYVFPEDEDVLQGCVLKDFYKCQPSLRSYIFEQIEESLHEKDPARTPARMKPVKLTTDHILPQRWYKNPKWRKIVLGSENVKDDAEAETDARIHTIGNLTLLSTSNNTEKSNHPLEEVKELFSEATVILNRDLAKEEEWNFDKIRERSKNLSEKICQIWSYPDDE